MRIGDVDVPSQLSVPAPAGVGTQGQRVYPFCIAVGYMIGKCRTCWTCWKSARYVVVGVIVEGGPAGFECVFFGAVSATLPTKPWPITTATFAFGPVTPAIAAGIGAAVASPPRILATSPAIPWSPGL